MPAAPTQCAERGRPGHTRAALTLTSFRTGRIGRRVGRAGGLVAGFGRPPMGGMADGRNGPSRRTNVPCGADKQTSNVGGQSRSWLKNEESRTFRPIRPVNRSWQSRCRWGRPVWMLRSRQPARSALQTGQLADVLWAAQAHRGRQRGPRPGGHGCLGLASIATSAPGSGRVRLDDKPATNDQGPDRRGQRSSP